MKNSQLLGAAAAAILDPEIGQKKKYWLIVRRKQIKCCCADRVMITDERVMSLSGVCLKDGLDSNGWNRMNARLREINEKGGIE